MIIEEKDFRLTPVDESSPMFDLDLLYIIKPNGKESRLEFKNAGYGLTLQNAIKKVAQYRVACNHKDEAVTLLAYFEEFKKELDSLKQLCGI